MIDITIYRSLTEVVTPASTSETWDNLLMRFFGHLRVGKKESAAGFGPYTLLDPRAGRKNSNVNRMTLAVFDADQAAPPIHTCLATLDAQGIDYFLYSTFSYPEKPAYRLVIPFANPLPPEQWRTVRQQMIDTFHIPAHPDQCKGPSHFYYLPSCRPDAKPVALRGHGRKLYDPSAMPAHPPFKVYSKPPPFKPPPIAQEPIDLAQYQEALRRRTTKLEQTDKPRATLLANLLFGLPLAPRGERNAATLRVTGMLVWQFPEASLEALELLITPSLNAMIEQGSKLTWQKVESMLLRGMKSRQTHEAEAEATLTILRQLYKAPRSTTPRPTSSSSSKTDNF